MPPIRRVSTGEADAAQVERERVEAVVASRLLLVLAVAGAAVVGAATHGHRAEHFAEQSAPFEAEVGEVPSSHWLPFQEAGGRRPISGASMSPARSLGPRAPRRLLDPGQPQKAPATGSRRAARRRCRPRACRGSGASGCRGPASTASRSRRPGSSAAERSGMTSTAGCRRVATAPAAPRSSRSCR